MRLVTRADLDGLTSAVLITEMEPVDSIELIHPQDLTDKKFEILKGDILANVPYHPNADKWFDHHLLTESNLKPPDKFDGAYRHAPSTARIVEEYYKSPKLKKYDALIQETDRMDSANLTLEDVLDPKGYILLGYTIDPRTGLGGFKEYFMLLLDALKNKTIDEILAMPEVQHRVNQMRSEWLIFKRLTLENSRIDGNVVLTDFRHIEKIPIGNRFLVYTLFPDANVSVRIHWGPQRQFVAAVVGHSIFNRTCNVNIGELMSDFGGGGHVGAGAAPLKAETANTDIEEIIRRLKA
ncbi:exopolyphosphatase [bacterium]|nr:exopolyphosphatase [bacterium]MCI0617388.1 exopolyphosphatase [bacterium]